MFTGVSIFADEGVHALHPRFGPRAETGRTQIGTLLRNEVKQMRVATGLTVLVLKLESLLCSAACEPASKCKKCVSDIANTLFATFSGRCNLWCRGSVVSGNGTKYGWSERLLGDPFYFLC